jgi:hypothetical protein
VPHWMGIACPDQVRAPLRGIASASPSTTGSIHGASDTDTNIAATLRH